MRGIVVIAAAVAIVSSTSSPAPAKERQLEVLQPSAPWTLNYGTNSCRMFRVFGAGDQQVAFYIERYGHSSNFTVLVAGKSISSLLDSHSTLRFSNGGGAANLTKGNFGAFGPAVFSTDGTLNPETLVLQKANANQISANDLSPAALRAITWVELTRVTRTVRLMTGPMDATMAAMDKCVDDLVRTWGVDPAELESIQSGPAPAENFVSAVVQRILAHCPSAARLKGSQATLAVRLTVDTTGHVAACELTDITQAKDFDDYPCEVFKKHGLFKPALDASGKAVKSIYRTRIVYKAD